MDIGFTIISAVMFFLMAIFIPISMGQHADLKVTMPKATPDNDNDYLCTAVEVPYDEAYVVGFTPLATMQKAHHMLVKGSATNSMSDPIWLCGHTGNPNGENKYKTGPFGEGAAPFIYAWARDAPALSLPEDVGFKIGRKTKNKYIVLQVHYATALSESDESGVLLHLTDIPQEKKAGVYVFGSFGSIPPMQTINLNMGCNLVSDDPVYPFAYRTHSHQIGMVISGWHVIDKSKWELIGKKDPHLPQMFYPVDTPEMVIHRGDAVAARCVFKSERSTVTYMGATAEDEMCNFYMMYYTDSENDVKFEGDCWAGNDYSWSDHFDNPPDKMANTWEGKYYPVKESTRLTGLRGILQSMGNVFSGTWKR